jgi:hypothetical protein
LRRSHRLALNAVCALAVLVAAGRLATSALSRVGAVREAAIEDATRSSAAEATAASQRSAAPRKGDGDIEVAADASAAWSAPIESASGLAQRSRDAGLAEPIVLDDPQTALGSAVAIHGRDPAAPRAIELWRVVGSRSARVATGRSRDDGTLELPALVLPAGEVLLVASPRSAGPNAAAASQPVRASRDPSAPHLVTRDETVDASGVGALLSLQVEPAEPGGELIVMRTIAALDAQPAQQVEIARAPVGAAADGTRAKLDLVVALEAGDTEVLVAQQLADGRRSPWRKVILNFGPEVDEDVFAVVDAVQP